MEKWLQPTKSLVETGVGGTRDSQGGIRDSYVLGAFPIFRRALNDVGIRPTSFRRSSKKARKGRKCLANSIWLTSIQSTALMNSRERIANQQGRDALC